MWGVVQSRSMIPGLSEIASVTITQVPEPSQPMQSRVRGNRCLIPSASGAIPLGGGQGVRVGWKISPEEEGQESKEFLAGK